MKHPRASALPLCVRCPASWAESQGKINESGEAAREGHLKHALAAAYFTGETDESVFHSIAGRYGFDLSAADRFMAQIRQMELSPASNSFTELEVKASVGDYEISGHIDLTVIVPGSGKAAVIDYKTGRLEVDPAKSNMQGLAYVVGAFQLFHDILEVDLIFFEERTYSFSKASFRRESLPEYEKILLDLVDSVMADDKQYSVGDHCKFCRGRVTCPAYNKELPMLVGDRLEPVVFRTLPPEAQAEMIGKLKAVEKWAGEAISQINGAVKDFDLALPLGNGDVYAATRKKKKEVDVRQVWGVVNSCGDRAHECVKVSRSQLMNILIDNAKEAGSKETKKALREQFEAQLAPMTTESTYIECRVMKESTYNKKRLEDKRDE